MAINAHALALAFSESRLVDEAATYEQSEDYESRSGLRVTQFYTCKHATAREKPEDSGPQLRVAKGALFDKPMAHGEVAIDAYPSKAPEPVYPSVIRTEIGALLILHEAVMDDRAQIDRLLCERLTSQSREFQQPVNE